MIFSCPNLRPNIYQELFCHAKQILGHGRYLVCKRIPRSKFLPLSHRKGAIRLEATFHPKAKCKCCPLECMINAVMASTLIWLSFHGYFAFVLRPSALGTVKLEHNTEAHYV